MDSDPKIYFGVIVHDTSPDPGQWDEILVLIFRIIAHLCLLPTTCSLYRTGN